MKINDQDVSVSYDVSSLFTNVPVDETIESIAERAFENDWFNKEHNLNITKSDLIELLRIATKNQLFQFEGNLYEQVDGVAMGSPLGPLMANAFMCNIEKQLETENKMPTCGCLPVYTSRKIKDEIKVREDKPPLVNQQCVVYHFQCNLCDAGYVGYTCRHLHQRIEEHKGTAIGNHLKDQHNMSPNDIARNFKILRKCQNKLDCLIFEMLFIKELKPTLNKQCDSIRAKLFV